MSEVRITGGLPMCRNPEEKQATLSKVLRISAVVLGTLAALAGALILFNIPGLSQLGTTIGWPAVAAGAFLILAGASIQCVKRPSQVRKVKWTSVRACEPMQASSSTSIANSLAGQTEMTDTGTDESKHVAQETTQKSPKEIENWFQQESPPRTKKREKPAQLTIGTLKKQAPSGIISQFPTWLQSYLRSIPYLILSTGSPPLDKLTNLVESPIFLYSFGDTVGICLRLKVAYISVDPSYDRSGEDLTYMRKEELPSSREPFTLSAFALKAGGDFASWSISANREYIEHRNAPYTTDGVLCANSFTCHWDSFLSQEVIDQFVSTENQEELRPEYRYHSGWILLRLFSKESIKVKEQRTDYLVHSFEDPPVGYWHITLDC